jgi:bud site selection protein 31
MGMMQASRKGGLPRACATQVLCVPQNFNKFPGHASAACLIPRHSQYLRLSLLKQRIRVQVARLLPRCHRTVRIVSVMPPTRTARNRKPPPEGFEGKQARHFQYSPGLVCLHRQANIGFCPGFFSRLRLHSSHTSVVHRLSNYHTRGKSSAANQELHADIEDTLLSFSQKMRDAESTSSNPTPGTSKASAVWPIFQISHQRSRYIYDLYYDREAISKQLYDWLLKNGYADANLIAKWKKQGYESLCCLRCIQTKETNFNSTCVCRVPRKDLKGEEGNGGGVECVNCGCRGCASGD